MGKAEFKSVSFYDVNDKKLVRIQQMQIDGSVEVENVKI